MERKIKFKTIAVLLVAITALSFYFSAFSPDVADAFVGIRYASKPSDSSGGFSSLSPLPCQEARFVRDTLNEAVLKNTDVLIKNNTVYTAYMIVYTVFMLCVLGGMILSHIRKYRLLI